MEYREDDLININIDGNGPECNEDGEWAAEYPEESLLELAPDRDRSVAYAEGFAAGKNTMLKEIIKRKLLKGQNSAQIAEDLDEDIMVVEMLIVQILERC